MTKKNQLKGNIWTPQVKPIIVKGETTGSLSNCAACHKRAEAGYYDDSAR
ncbi:MAG: hypothetical protein AB7U45_11570 [Desulfamplus sp.]